MFLLVSFRHVGAHPDKTFPRISRIRIIPSLQILARVFVYKLPPFICQILDLAWHWKPVIWEEYFLELVRALRCIIWSSLFSWHWMIRDLLSVLNWHSDYVNPPSTIIQATSRGEINLFWTLSLPPLSNFSLWGRFTGRGSKNKM